MKAVKQILTQLSSAISGITQSTISYLTERFHTLLAIGAIVALAPFAAGAQSSDNSVVPPQGAFIPGYTGIGPVISGSVEYKTIPSNARKFLERHCNGHAIVKCTKQFTSGTYIIGLADGIEMEFDTKGNLIFIEAPSGYSLSPTLLSAVVPGKLYHLLVHNGFRESVEAVHRDKAGYRLEISDPVFDQACFDSSGVLTLVVEKKPSETQRNTTGGVSGATSRHTFRR